MFAPPVTLVTFVTFVTCITLLLKLPIGCLA